MTEEFIDLSGVNFDETFEPTVLADGEEAELRIVSFMKNVDKNGRDFIMPFFEIPEDQFSKEFGDFLPLPHAEMSPKEKNTALLKLQGFSEAFGIDLSSQLDIKNDIVGQTGWAILGVGKDQDGNPTNKIRKYVRGK